MPHYFISIAVESPFHIELEARFHLGQDQTQQDFQLPVWRPGRYQRFNFAQYIQQLSVTDSYGNALPFHKRAPSTWRVQTRSNEEVVFRYRYYGDQLDAGRTFWDGETLVFNPVSALVYPLGQESTACTCYFELPEGWNCISLLDKNEETGLLEAGDYHQLFDAPTLAAPQLQQIRYECEGAAFNFWASGAVKLDAAMLVKDFRRFSEAYYRLFEGWPFQDYHFLLHAPSLPHYHGLEHANGTMLILGPAAEVSSKKYRDLLGVASHELFHAWNVKAVKPTHFTPYDYTQPPVSPLGYVYEGATTYYGDLMLLRSGVFSWQAYVAEMNTLLRRHLHNDGRRHLSVADSSRDTELDGYQMGVPYRKASIYIEGAVISFLLDIELRRATHNVYGLDEVFRRLYQKFGQGGGGYEEADFWRLVSEVAGVDFDGWYRRLVAGTEDTLPAIRQALDYLGLMLEEHPADYLIEAALGIKLNSVRKDGQGPEILHLAQDSPQNGPLRRGDRLVALGGVALRDSIPDELLRALGNGPTEVCFVRQGRLLCLQLELTLEPRFFSKWTVKPHNNRSARQQAAFQAWSWGALI